MIFVSTCDSNRVWYSNVLGAFKLPLYETAVVMAMMVIDSIQGVSNYLRGLV